MAIEGRSTFGALYKVSCILLLVVGLITAFPFVAYALVLGLASFAHGGLLNLLAVATFLLTLGWALMSSAARWKSTALSSFIAPTILGGTGAVLAYFFRGWYLGY